MHLVASAPPPLPPPPPPPPPPCATCHAGYAPGYKDANQDSCLAFSAFGGPGAALLGVFDGHGSLGHHVSGFLRRALPPLVYKWAPALAGPLRRSIAGRQRRLAWAGAPCG